MVERIGQNGNNGHHPAPDQRVCVYCASKASEACVAACQSEGKYRYLVPEPLPQWEAPPELPSLKNCWNCPRI